MVTDKTPEWVIDEVLASGIRGRGGAGFPTGQKWKFADNSVSDQKYLICNGDEGDPGAFMDASIMDGDPHAVIEGMIIGSYAIGARDGYIYVRAEYPLAVKRLRLAIAQAEELGYLGDHVFGSDWSFHLKIKEGAGAFVCGEETALMASIEGRRGMPRSRPPFPAVSGLWGKPTNINNVETFANIPWIITHGAAAYAALGTEKSRGTKAFSLAGKLVNGGLAEVPIGSTISEMVYGVGGGIKDGREFKAVQLGGPSGGCVPAALIDTPIDYESLAATGAIMGSGGMVVADDQTCMVDLARYFLQFTQNESCGKCVPCRIGTKRMLEILERITAGEGEDGDIERLQKLAAHDQAHQPLRPRPDGPQPGAHHHPLLPRRVRGPHLRRGLPGAGLQRAHQLPHRPRDLHRLRPVRQEVPGRRGERRAQAGARDRSSTSAPSATPAARSASSSAVERLTGDEVGALRGRAVGAAGLRPSDAGPTPLALAGEVR